MRKSAQQVAAACAALQAEHGATCRSTPLTQLQKLLLRVLGHHGGSAVVPGTPANLACASHAPAHMRGFATSSKGAKLDASVTSAAQATVAEQNPLVAAFQLGQDSAASRGLGARKLSPQAALTALASRAAAEARESALAARSPSRASSPSKRARASATPAAPPAKGSRPRAAPKPPPAANALAAEAQPGPGPELEAGTQSSAPKPSKGPAPGASSGADAEAGSASPRPAKPAAQVLPSAAAAPPQAPVAAPQAPPTPGHSSQADRNPGAAGAPIFSETGSANVLASGSTSTNASATASGDLSGGAGWGAAAAASAGSRPALERAVTYGSLQEMVVALEKRQHPPTHNNLVQLLGTVESVVGSPAAHARLHRALEGLIKGPYGATLPPLSLAHALLTLSREGAWGPGAVALAKRIAAALHAPDALANDSHWVSMALFAIARTHVAATGQGASGERRAAAREVLAVARPAVGGLADLAREHVGRWPEVAVANLFWSYSRLTMLDNQLLRAACAAAVQGLPRFAPYTLATISYSCALFGRSGTRGDVLKRNTTLLPELVAELERRRFEGFRTQEVANAVWATAKLGIRSQPLLQTACDVVASEEWLRASGTQEWSNVLYALALFDHYDPRVFDQLARAMLTPEQQRYKPHHRRHLHLQQLHPHPQQQQQQQYLRELQGQGAGSMAAEELAGGPDGDAPAPQSSTFSSSPTSSPTSLSLASFTSPSSASSACPSTPTPDAPQAAPADSLRASLSPFLLSCTPQSASNALFAMGVLRHLDERVVDAFLDRLRVDPAATSVPDRVLAARACTQLGYRPPELDALLLESLDRFKAEESTLMAQSLMWCLLNTRAVEEPRYRPLVQHLVHCINTYNPRAWQAATGAHAPRKHTDREERFRARQDELQATWAFREEMRAGGAGAGAEGAEGAAAPPLSPEEEAERRHQEERYMAMLPDDVNQLWQYVCEAERQGLTGPAFRLRLPLDRMAAEVALHRSEAAMVHAGKLVIQGFVAKAVRHMIVSGAFPSVRRVDEEVLLGRDCVSSDIIVHMVHPDDLHLLAEAQAERDRQREGLREVEGAGGVGPEAEGGAWAWEEGLRAATEAEAAAEEAAALAALSRPDSLDALEAADAATAAAKDASTDEEEDDRAEPGAESSSGSGSGSGSSNYAAAMSPLQMAGIAPRDGAGGAPTPDGGAAVPAGLQTRPIAGAGAALPDATAQRLAHARRAMDKSIARDSAIVLAASWAPKTPTAVAAAAAACAAAARESGVKVRTYPVAIEVDGPWHFMRNRRSHANAKTSYRNYVLATLLGGEPANVITIPTQIWVEMLANNELRRRYLWSMLRKTKPPPREPAGFEVWGWTFSAEGWVRKADVGEGGGGMWGGIVPPAPGSVPPGRKGRSGEEAEGGQSAGGEGRQ
ncbi:hypothetical protein HYH03_002178 [Edaphochlamys debaryana]|uniref:RAP domain-containing protein n=1 Tax=Edaphochlamys debaryana TaxID=47281 RepID=A0A835YDU3_9CHLO|nr:hypothetical protein HYH03_002178 [Edaphochlamys debaryana]|eukprot:KAG2499889.1 hypothetical protein HYH03_002178 [Edaphochlamys debaryana]